MQKVKQVMSKLSSSSSDDSPRAGQQEFFTKVEDRPVVKEVKELVKEHHPVEREFVRETHATGGERQLVEGEVTDILGTTERVVGAPPPKPPGA